MDTKDMILSLLRQKNIVKIIYVDNYFEKDCFYINASTFVREKFTDTNIKFPFEVYISDDEITMDSFKRWWENANFEDIKDFTLKHNIQKELTDIESILLGIFPNENFSCLTPNEFKVNYIDNKNLVIDQEHQLLILMDKYLDEQNADSGMKLLGNFVNHDFISCGLFSNKFAIDGEIDNLCDYETTNNVYPLSKARVVKDNEDLLLFGLRNVLWFNEISKIKKCTLSLYDKAIENVKEELKSFDPSSFYNAIIHSSRIEGCWEFDLIKRVVNLILNKEIEKVMTSEEEFSKIQSNTKTLKKMDSDLDSDSEIFPIPKTKILKELVQSEIYDDIKYLNFTYSQISNGDIFSIKSKEYMLACQPCNLEIRGDGSRKSKEFVYLLPIEDLDEEIKKYGKQIYISKLYGLNDEKPKCVKLSNYKRICPYILDLTSFNKDGKATLKLSQNEEDLEDCEYMQKNMLKVYKKIYNKISQYVLCCENLKSSNINDTSKKIITKLLTKPFEMASEGFIKVNKINDENGNTIVDFGIKRINRYKEPYSQIVLQDFSNYLSRQSLPHDFSKQS